MPTMRERVAEWESQRNQLLQKQQELTDRLEALQTKLDQSPGQQQVNLLQQEMETMRTALQAATDKLETLQATPPPSLSLDAPDDTNPNAPAPGARLDAQPVPASNPRRKAFL